MLSRLGRSKSPDERITRMILCEFININSLTYSIKYKTIGGPVTSISTLPSASIDTLKVSCKGGVFAYTFYIIVTDNPVLKNMCIL